MMSSLTFHVSPTVHTLTKINHPPCSSSKTTRLLSSSASLLCFAGARGPILKNLPARPGDLSCSTGTTSSVYFCFQFYLHVHWVAWEKKEEVFLTTCNKPIHQI